MSGFSAYIDESGCDGFDFGKGSSDFLVLGAVIARTRNLHLFDAAVAGARTEAGKPADHYFKSFKKLKNTDAQRWCIAKHLSSVQCQVAAVAVHKPSLTAAGWAENKDDLYFQASKFLIERISWACRDAHSVKAEAEPECAIIFSKKAGLRYEALREYMSRLRSDPARYGTNAEWAHLNPDVVVDEPHADANPRHLAADHFAANLGSALEHKMYGIFDDRFIRAWVPRFYSANGSVIGNGLKIWPNEGYSVLRNDPRGAWMKMSFGWK